MTQYDIWYTIIGEARPPQIMLVWASDINDATEQAKTKLSKFFSGKKVSYRVYPTATIYGELDL